MKFFKYQRYRHVNGCEPDSCSPSSEVEELDLAGYIIWA